MQESVKKLCAILDAGDRNQFETRLLKLLEAGKSMRVANSINLSMCQYLWDQAVAEIELAPIPEIRRPLSRRELQIIPLLAEGLSNKEIADRIFLSEQTVKNHLHRIKNKTQATSRIGIVTVCKELGML